MTGKKQLGIIYSVTFIIMLAVNYFATSEVGMVANDDPAIIQPAGYAFSIWGLIYFLLFIWIARFFFTSHDRNRVYETVHYWPIANFILNGLWIIAFTQQWYLASVIIIIGLLITLFFIYRNISHVSTHWFDRLPFSVYFGWVTIATIVNINTWVKEMGVEEVLGFNEYQWTLALLMIATGIAAYVSLKHRDWVYPLVFVWAYIAIVLRTEYEFFWLTAVCAASVLVHIGVSLYAGVKRIKTS